MRYNEQSLSKAYKAGALSGVILLYGGETYLVEQWAKTLMGEEDSPFNTQRLDGKKPDLDVLWDALQALPLFGGEKRVLLDGLEASSLNAQEQKEFAALLEEPSDSLLFVITAKEPGFGSSATGKKLIKLVEQRGSVAELAPRSAGDLVKFLTRQAKASGCELSPELARYLLQICPGEMQILENELAKICAYTGEGSITKAHIDGVAIPKIEARAFDLQKHILAGEPGKALSLLADLFQLREEPIAILGALSMSFCDLYRARCVRDAGGNQSSLAGDFGYKSEYRARRAFEQSGRLDTGTLREAVSLLCDCDRGMKSTGVDTRLRLEQLTVRLSGLCGGRR